MKALILSFAIGLITLTTQVIGRPDSVHICVSKGAIAYHQTLSCRGLRSCKHQIIKVSLSDAINKYHLRECHVCYSKY